MIGSEVVGGPAGQALPCRFGQVRALPTVPAVLASYVVAVANRTHLDPPPPPPAPPSTLCGALSRLFGGSRPAAPADRAHPDARHVETLLGLLEEEPPGSTVLRDQLRPVAATALDVLQWAGKYRRQALLRRWIEGARWSTSPRTAYNAACYRVLEPDGALACGPSAVELLRIAVLDQRSKDRARTDPTLEGLHEDEGFAALVGGPVRTDLWAVEPFAAHRDALRDAGISRVVQLAGAGRLLRRRLARLLGTDRLVVDRLAAVAAFATVVNSIPDGHRLHPLRVELLAALVETGVERFDDVRDPATASAVVAVLQERHIGTRLQRECVAGWLGAVRPPCSRATRLHPDGAGATGTAGSVQDAAVRP